MEKIKWKRMENKDSGYLDWNRVGCAEIRDSIESSRMLVSKEKIRKYESPRKLQFSRGWR